MVKKKIRMIQNKLNRDSTGDRITGKFTKSYDPKIFMKII